MSQLMNCAAFKTLLRTEVKLHLVLLNIDNFSNINHSFGIDYGDEIFKKVESELHTFNFPEIEIYKLESDEFALVSFKKNLCNEELIEIAKEISSYFNQTPMELDEDITVSLTFSIGIASGKGLSVLNNARLAIKDLREHTKGSYKLYDVKSPYIAEIHENVYWVNKIQEAVAADNIIAYYQPIIDNKTHKIEKYECLARVDDDGNLISPYHFMKAARKTRILSLITKSIIKQACRMFRSSEFEFSINITNDDLQLGYLEEYLLHNASINNIAPQRIVLELLEDISSLDAGTILEQLASLKSKGFKLAIDDFGSESSNFSRLLEFQPDYLKIDGTFIKNLLTDTKSQIITSGIVSIAHQMGIEIIAEFIHSQELQEKVEELGIDYSQGFIHGEPTREIES